MSDYWMDEALEEASKAVDEAEQYAEQWELEFILQQTYGCKAFQKTDSYTVAIRENNRAIRAGTDPESGLHDLPYYPWDGRIDSMAQMSGECVGAGASYGPREDMIPQVFDYPSDEADYRGDTSPQCRPNYAYREKVNRDWINVAVSLSIFVVLIGSILGIICFRVLQ